MAGIITPEKIKNVLSSFLVKAEISPYTQDTSSRKSATQDNGDTPDDDASISKSSTVALRSRKSFLRRLDTFSPGTWFGKSSDLSPLICARHGWENVDIDMLECAGCKLFLSGKLPMMNETEAYKQSLKKLKENIVTAHDRLCVLGSFPCPEEFCHIQVDDVASLLAGFNERATNISRIQDQLPPLDLSDMEKLGYDEGQAGAYCKRNLMPDKDISPQAVTLAIAGWTVSSANKDVLICSLCRRKIGLWNFTPASRTSCEQEDSSDKESDSEDRVERDPKPKRIKLSRKDSLNPITEHNYWCPWVQRVSAISKSSKTALAPPLPSSPQESTPCVTPSRGTPGSGQQTAADAATIPAFIAALKSIAPGLMDNNIGLATGMKKSPMTEGLRCFRRAMDTWSSPKAKSPETIKQSIE